MNEQLKNQPTADQEETILEMDSQAALYKALQGSAANGKVQTVPPGGYGLERGSGPGLLDWVFDRAAARKHQEVMSLIRDTTIETMEAMNAATLLTTDFAANSMEAEYTIEQVIRQYKDSPTVLASAPMYVQLARSMQMQTVPGIAQAGVNRIKRKIEQR